MINENQAKKYCKDFTKIENYDKAIADTTQVWHCHHSEEVKRKISEAHKGKHWKLVDGKRVWY